MIKWSLVNARSEFAKFSPDGAGAGGVPAGCCGGGAGALGSGSGGVGVPAGDLGSKKPSGFGRLLTSSMLRAATPASKNPAFNPARESCAGPSVTTMNKRAAKHTTLFETDFISEAPGALHPYARSPLSGRQQHRMRMRKLPTPGRRPKRRIIRRPL